MNEFDRIVNSLKVHLETDKLAGVEEILQTIKEPDITHAALFTTPKEKETALQKLNRKAEDCKACQLHGKRTNLVFGSGNPAARLMFIGEAPGRDEDLKGLPFVGRAGQLLTKMIEAINMKRADAYIANILKCRPPNNRPPFPDEVSACTHFVMDQIKIIQPKVVCTLGKFAAQFLLDSKQPISALRGRFYDMDGFKVLPTFHPAYLLRNPADKKLVWEDLKKVRDELKSI